MSSGNPYRDGPNQVPPRTQSGGTNAGIIVAIVVAVVAVPVLLMCAGVLVALLLPAVSASREAARRMQCSNNLKQLALAIHNYESVYNSLPPAYTADASGRPLHSWRTLILPYMEQDALYQQIDLSKPWDDPVNQTIGAIEIPGYSCPSAGAPATYTTYVAVVDPSGAFSGSTPTTFGQITDGTSNTILVIETDVSRAVPWMSPTDDDLTVFSSATGTVANHRGGVNAAFADVSVHFLSGNLDAAARRAFVTKDGGEAVSSTY